MKIGIDLVQISGLKKRLENIGVPEIVFLDSELAHAKSLDSLAGIFASKEAFMKAIGKKVDWKDVWVEHEPTGRPILRTMLDINNSPIHLSISHDGDYAIAMVVLQS